MTEAKSGFPLKIGLFLAASSWFLFTLYQFIKGTLYGSTVGWPDWILLTDTAGIIGIAFRTVASFMAVIAILFYLFRKDLSPPEAMMTLRWILIGEAAYWLVLLPSGVWGMTGITGITGANFDLGFVIETGIPCLMESIVIPVVLVKLFFELNPKKPASGAIKWGLISGTAYVFVFWLNNTCNWIAAIMEKGIDYVLFYPANLLSFALTSVGLLALTVAAAYVSKKSIGTESLNKLNLRRIGALVIALGLYFDAIYLLFVFFGTVGGWGTWYAWFLGHNADLWVLSLPLVGVPLLFERQAP